MHVQYIPYTISETDPLIANVDYVDWIDSDLWKSAKFNVVLGTNVQQNLDTSVGSVFRKNDWINLFCLFKLSAVLSINLQ